MEGRKSGSWRIWPGLRGLRRRSLPRLEYRLLTARSSPSARAGRALDADPTANPQSPCRCAGCPVVPGDLESAVDPSARKVTARDREGCIEWGAEAEGA